MVRLLGTVCRQFSHPMPHIISESGRALRPSRPAAHQRHRCGGAHRAGDPRAPGGSPPVLVELKENLEALTLDRVDEVFRDAVFAKERLQELFASDAITLRDMADIDQYYLATMNGIAAMIAHDRASYPEIVSHLEATLVDRYFCNFSVFQSLPDNWAIDQIFPIMPVHRLDEEPIRRGTLQDITCDSDGVIDGCRGRKGKPAQGCIRSGRGPYIWASSSPAPTRSWATSTTCSATPMRSTSR